MNLIKEQLKRSLTHVIDRFSFGHIVKMHCTPLFLGLDVCIDLWLTLVNFIVCIHIQI